MQSERIASDILREYSQSTQYLFDWSTNLQESRTNFKEQNALAQKKASHERLFVLKKVNSKQAIKQISQNRIQKKQEILSRFQFPILEETLGKKSEGRKLVKGRMKLTLCQIKKGKDKKEGLNRVIDRIVDEQLRKMDDFEYRSVGDERRQRLHSHYQKPQALLKAKINSLPSIYSEKKNLQSSKSPCKNNPAIFINNNEPEERYKPGQLSIPTCRALKDTLFQ